jgi:hypothetical protein
MKVPQKISLTTYISTMASLNIHYEKRNVLQLGLQLGFNNFEL